MASPLPFVTAADLTAFSFSPSSPPGASSALANGQPTFPFPLETSPPPSFPSHVSPALFSPHSAASTASISQSISQNLGPVSPFRQDDAAMDENPARSGHTSRMGSAGNGMDGGMDVEDELRRGPPTSDTPGGDCKNVCIRHARMANGSTNLMLQKSIENLAPNEQQAVNTIWSLFSSSPSKRRLLILRGLLTIACPSQLSFLQEALALEMRLDPVELLPREVTLKIFGYLDAISLGRAAQVSSAWKSMADDDLLWRTMCEQHIERKCEKCGWGLPLLGERRRKARLAMNALPAAKAGEGVGPGRDKVLEDVATLAAAAQQQHQQQHHQADSDYAIPSPTSTSSMVVDHSDFHRHKRSKTNSPAPSRATSPRPSSPGGRSAARPLPPPPSASTSAIPLTRPWKHVYCERLAIERNWRRGACVATVLSGHTDSITCLQVAEDLPHPSFPVLMTGSWDRSVRIWNLETGKEVGVLRGHSRGVRALQFDALKLVTGSMDSTLKIWNWRTGECMRTLRGHRDAVICLTYDQQLLVSGSGDSTIRVWDFGTGEVYTLRGHSEWVNSVALWDSKSDGCEPSTTAAGGEVGAPTSNPEQAKQSNMGKYLFSASDDATIRVWDLYTRTCVRVLSGHVAQVQSLKVYVVSAAETQKDGGNNGFPTNLLEPPATTPATEEFPDVGHSAPPCSTSRLPVPNIAVAPASTAPPQPDFEFSGDRKPVVVSASLDNTIRVWDVEKAQCLRTGFGHLEGVWDVDVDKLRIVSASHDRTLKIWDRDTGRCLHTLIGHKSAVTAALLSDQQIVSGSDDGEVRVWSFAPNPV